MTGEQPAVTMAHTANSPGAANVLAPSTALHGQPAVSVCYHTQQVVAAKQAEAERARDRADVLFAEANSLSVAAAQAHVQAPEKPHPVINGFAGSIHLETATAEQSAPIVAPVDCTGKADESAHGNLLQHDASAGNASTHVVDGGTSGTIANDEHDDAIGSANTNAAAQPSEVTPPKLPATNTVPQRLSPEQPSEGG